MIQFAGQFVLASHIELGVGRGVCSLTDAERLWPGAPAAWSNTNCWCELLLTCLSRVVGSIILIGEELSHYQDDVIWPYGANIAILDTMPKVKNGIKLCEVNVYIFFYCSSFNLSGFKHASCCIAVQCSFAPNSSQ